MLWPFAKYSGCGNDFILFDNRNERFPLSSPPLISKLCHRQSGIGADGVLLLESSQAGDCRMRIFNADGSEAEMCGNGLRCFVKWLPTLGFKQQEFRIETKHAVLTARLADTDVTIDMPNPIDLQWDLTINFLGKPSLMHQMNTGVPHIIIFHDNIDEININRLGSELRHYWQSNVNFAQVQGRGRLKIRTYERGVEAETLACGTGVTAASLAAAYQFGFAECCLVETRSKEILTIGFKYHEGRFSEIKMTGPAVCTFTGEVVV